MTWMSLLQKLFMNYVPGELCLLEPSIARHPVTPSSVKNVFNSVPASVFIDMGYISTKKFPLDNN